MPQAIVAAAAWLVSATTIGTVAGWSMAIEFVLSTAISYGLGRLVSRQPSGSLTSSGSAVDLRIDSLTPRRVIYGESGSGGCLRFRHSGGTNNKYLWLIIVWAGHECEALTSFLVNGAVVTPDGSGFALGGKLRVTHHLGAYNQAADANFVSELAGIWTTDCKLSGNCYSAIRLEWDTNQFPAGVPQFLAVLKGRKVYDWRDGTQDPTDYSTWKWSDNVALCTADYIRGVPTLDESGALFRPYGVAAPDDSLPSAKWIADANACDESVSLAAGGTEKRYTCNGSFDTDSAPPNVLDALAGAMAGKIVPIGTEFHPYAGVWVDPDFTVDETMLRGLPSASNPLARTDRLNVVKGTFNDPVSNYQANDFPPIVSDTFIDADGGELSKDLPLSFTNSSTMAQRIAKIALLRSRQGIVTAWPCNLRAVPALTGENVMLTSAEFGWSSKNFELSQFQLSIQNGDGGGVGFVPDLVMQETDSSIFDWSTSEEQAIDPAPNTNLPDPRTVAAPTSLSLTVTSFRQPEGNLVAQLKAAWTAPADQLVQQGGVIRIQYKKHADSDWIEGGTVKGDQVFTYLLALLIGTAYDVQIRAENTFSATSAWVQSLNFAMTADVTGPAARTDLAAVVGTGKSVSLSWTANAEADFGGKYNIYRALTGAGRTKIATVFSNRFVDVNVTLGTAYDYDVRGLDQTGNEALTSNVVTATPTAVAAGSVDSTAPTDPATPSINSTGTVTAGDGSVTAYTILNVPNSGGFATMPAGAVSVEVLARVHGATGWTTYNEFFAGDPVTTRVDGLAPNTAYDYGFRAISFSGAVSNTVTLNNQTSANKGAGSSPASGSFQGPSTVNIPPRYLNFSGPIQSKACRVIWAASTDKDVALYEWVTTESLATGGGAASTDFDAAWTAYSAADKSAHTTADLSAFHYSIIIDAYDIAVRAVNASGARSSWLNLGDPRSTMDYPAGAMSAQQPSGVAISGGNITTSGVAISGPTIATASRKTGTVSASSVRNIVAEYSETKVITLVGGAVQEDVSVDLTNRGFTTKPDVGACELAGTSITNADRLYGVIYNYDNGSNGSNQAWLKVFRFDGANLAAGNIRVSIHFIQYS